MPGVIRPIRASLGYAIVAVIIVVYLVMQPREGLLTSFNAALVLAAACAFIKALTLLHQSLPNPEQVIRLARAIHHEAHELLKMNCAKLCPAHDADPYTAFLRIEAADDDSVVVYRVNWDEYHYQAPSRMFKIGPKGQLARHSNDPRWRNAPLIQQLEDLLGALQGNYAPRFEVRRVRREDH